MHQKEEAHRKMPQTTYETVSTLLHPQIVYLPVKYRFVRTVLGPTNPFARVQSDRPAISAGGRRGTVAMVVGVFMMFLCKVILIINV
jgi:hypothetical protein